MYSEVLRGVVVPDGLRSKVRYADLNKSPEKLQAYLAVIAAVTEKDFSAMGTPQRLAFLINAYNAYTLDLVRSNYPVKSIRDIGGTEGPWKLPFAQLLGKKRTLDEIEHELIRKAFPEPRIHFALVCASKGCPPLRSEAFRADKLEQQLAQATANFLADKERNRFDAAKKALQLSSIFDWFKDDFVKAKGSVEAFVAPYFGGTAAIAPGKVGLSYFPYDWSLNE